MSPYENSKEETQSDYFSDTPITNALIEELKKPCDGDRKDLITLCREFEREITRLKNGSQGSCYCCEPVGILNQKLREIVERYRVWATSENPTQIELQRLKQKYDELN